MTHYIVDTGYIIKHILHTSYHLKILLTFCSDMFHNSNCVVTYVIQRTIWNIGYMILICFSKRFSSTVMQYAVLIVTIYCHAVQLYSVLMERLIYTISEIEQQKYTDLKVGHNGYNTLMFQPCPTRPVVTSGVDSDLEDDSQESIYKVSGVLRLERPSFGSWTKH